MAKEFARKVGVELAEGDHFDLRRGKQPFGEVARRWLDESNPSKRESTWARDEIVIRVHLAPIEDVPIAMVQPKDVRKLVAKWASTLAPRTVHRNYEVFRAICNWAVGEDIIRRSPCRGVKLPSKGKSSNGRALTSEELTRLVEEMEPSDKALTWVMALLGLRWGEAAALRVGSIKLGDVSELVVSETVQRGVGGRRFAGPPKSDAGVRRLTVPKALTEMLSAQLECRGLDESDTDARIFVNKNGELLDATNWRRRVWIPAAIRAGLGKQVEDDGGKKYEGVTPHDLRRTNATAMVGADVDIKTAQARLGHLDIRMTLDVYARVLAERDQEAADAVAEALMPRLSK